MRYFFVGFTPALSKASTFNVPVSRLVSPEDCPAESFPDPQPCAANTATSTGTASKAGDRRNRQFLFTMSPPSKPAQTFARRRVANPKPLAFSARGGSFTWVSTSRTDAPTDRRLGQGDLGPRHVSGLLTGSGPWFTRSRA